MQFLQARLTAVLCLSLTGQSLPVASQSGTTAPVPGSQKSADRNRAANSPTQLQGDDRILHALNRFTFGPRSGDLAAVRAMGLEKWFDLQLHPSLIDEAELRGRLAQFPAMEWTPEQLLYRVPSNGIIRQTMTGKIPIPERGALRAVYENQIFRYSEKKREKEQKSGTAASKPGDIAATPEKDGVADPNDMRVSDAPRTAVDEEQLARLTSLAPAQRVSALVTMRPEAADALFKSLKPLQRASLVSDLTPDLKEVVLDLEGPQRLVNQEIIAQRLTRDIYASAQLQEVMTDFWMNHFNMFLHKNDETPYYLVSYERDVIRPRALGKFEDLLEATAHSPAMLLYLDNASSIGADSLAAERAQFRPNDKKRREGLNENYARELMELHTVGVNGGYTQADVTQVARILTGWTVDRPQRGGGFQFDPRRHEPGTKSVMGKKFEDHGEQEGRELLHMLATRPATAQFISRKLAVRFVSDDPPQSLVDRLAKTFLNTNGDIKAILTSALPVAGVLGRRHVSRQGEDADRIRSLCGAREQCRNREPPAACQCSARDGHADVRMRDTQWLQLDCRHLGQHQCARQSNEFRAVPGSESASRELPSTGIRARTIGAPQARRSTAPASQMHKRKKRALKHCCSRAESASLPAPPCCSSSNSSDIRKRQALPS